MINWTLKQIDETLDYIQPTKYIVKSTDYDDSFETPVLTPGKSFILGKTNEKEGIFFDVPVIIFDDFTTAFKYVDFPFKVKSSAMKILTTKTEDYDIKFLFYLMSTIKYEADEHKRYWISKYSKQSIKVPNLSIQKRIAEILDAADAYRQKTKALINKYDELAQSLFIDMFGDPVTNPKGWENCTLPQLVSKDKYSLKRGPFGGALKKSIFVESGYLVYEQYHALNDDFSFGRYFIDSNKFQELEAFEVKSDDIIVSCSGVYMGKLAIVPKDAEKGIINQALLKITLDQTKMTNTFFVTLFRFQPFLEKLLGDTRGSGIPNFPPMSIVKKFPFPTPPLKLQNEFTVMRDKIENQKQLATRNLKYAEELFQSLLQKAFKGELV